jgi:hypothetical protein
MMERNAKMSTAQHSLRRRLLASAQEETSEWLYEAYLTDTGEWYGKRCPAIVFNVKQGEQYLIEWSNVRTVSKYIYDMRRCGGTYKLYGSGHDGIPDASGTIEITIPADGTLYVGVGSNANVAHGGYKANCFDGDYIRIRKE